MTFLALPARVTPMTSAFARILFSPGDLNVNPDQSVVVVHRPAPATDLQNPPRQGLAIAIEAYPPMGWEPLEATTRKRLPCFQKVVWCSTDERSQWDRGTGGQPGKPLLDTSGPVRRYLSVDAPAVERVIVQARAELLRRAPPGPLHERVREAILRLDDGPKQKGGQSFLIGVLAVSWGVDFDTAEKALQRYLRTGTIALTRLMDILTVLGFEVSNLSFHCVMPPSPTVGYAKLANDSAEQAEGRMEGVRSLRGDFDQGQLRREGVKTAARYAAQVADHAADATQWSTLAAGQTPYNPTEVQEAADAAEKAAGFAKDATKLVQDLTERFSE